MILKVSGRDWLPWWWEWQVPGTEFRPWRPYCGRVLVQQPTATQNISHTIAGMNIIKSFCKDWPVPDQCWRYHFLSGVAKWVRAANLKSGVPWFKSYILPPAGFVLGRVVLISSAKVCNGLASHQWVFFTRLHLIFFICLFVYNHSEWPSFYLNYISMNNTLVELALNTLSNVWPQLFKD